MGEVLTSKFKRTIVLLILSLIAGMVYLTPLLRFSFYDQMIQALKINDIQLGTIGAVYGVFNVSCYAPSGFLSERFNTKKLLIISTLGMCLTTIWYSFCPGYASVLVIHGLFGIFSVGTFWSPYLKALRQLGSEEEQGRIFGMSESLRGIGQTLVAAGCLGAAALFASERAGFRTLLLINAVVFALLTAAVIVFIPDFQEEKGAQGEKAGGESSQKENLVWKILTSSYTWICILVVMCGYNLWVTVNGYIGTYCTRVLGISMSLSSSLSIVRSYIIVFAAGITGGYIIDKFKTRGKGMMLAFLLIGLSVAGIVLTDKVTAVCIAVTVVLSYLVNVVKATYWSVMGDAGVPVEYTGMATGIISLVGLTPEIFSSPIVSRFIAYGESIGKVETGFDLMFVWLGVWAVIGIFSGWILKRKKEKSLQIL